MNFGTHCDTSLAVFEAMCARRCVTLIRTKEGAPVKPYTMNFRPFVAKCKSWLA